MNLVQYFLPALQVRDVIQVFAGCLNRFDELSLRRLSPGISIYGVVGVDPVRYGRTYSGDELGDLAR